ncbi:MAG: BamA/TamA family outer membrane protein, partial [Pseudomonadota bacterium]
YQTPDLVEAVDLAASPDGKRIGLLIKRAGAWQVLEFDRAGGAPRVLLNHDAPIHSLRYARDGNGLEFIAATGGIYNLWRYSSGTQELARLSHTDTAVMSHSGVAQDGSVVLAVLADGGTELRRMQATTALARSRADTRQSAPLEAAAPPATRQLGEASGYLALKSLYPRAWMPAALADRGLTAYGVSIFGSDALLWHHYSASLLWETSQHEAIGSFSYNYLDAVFLDFSRNLQTREWTGSGKDETVTRYDRTTAAQISSLLPLMASVDRRLFVGIGAAMQTTDQVQVDGATTRAEDERVGAAFLRYDSRESNWYADSFNRGNLSTLLYESYQPFDSYYDGHIARFDTHGYLPLGKTVLSARWTEARAYGITEPFYLGGAFEPELTQVPMLNQRDLPLRGYRNGTLELRGQNASTASIEWRTPIADIDRHAMTPPIGIKRLSAAVFVDAGRAWDNGAAKPKYYRGVGVELLGEIRLIYLVTVPVRLGIARGVDQTGDVQGYLRLGQSF